VVALLVARQGAIPAGADPVMLVVDDDGFATATDCDATTVTFNTIQTAVDAASPGDTILVCPGTYNEQVVVDESGLTVQGSGGGTVIAPTTVAPNTTSLFSGADIAAIVLVKDVTDVTLKDLAVDGGPAPGGITGCSPGYMGIFYRNASGLVEGVTVQDVFLGPSLSGCQSVLGIFVQSGGSGSSHVSVTGSSVTNYGKNGITCNEPGTACEITENTVTGRGPTGLGDAAQNGIQVAFGATGLVRGNTVTDHDYTPETFVACGLLWFEASGVRASKNILRDDEANICNFGKGGGQFNPAP
jgi:ribosomal protein S27E